MKAIMLMLVVISMIPQASALQVSLDMESEVERGDNTLGLLKLKNEKSSSETIESVMVVSKNSLDSGFSKFGNTPFEFTLPKGPITISAGGKTNFSINVSVPSYSPSGIWRGYFIIFHNGTQTSTPFSMNVVQSFKQEYSYTLPNTSIIISSGDRGSIPLNFSNDGNVPIVIRFFNEEFFKNITDTVVNPFHAVNIGIPYEIPWNFTGDVQSNISFLDENIMIDFIISDNAIPEIQMNFSDILKIDNFQEINVSYKDNIQGSQILLMLTSPKGLVKIHNDSVRFKVEEFGRWKINLTVIDSSNNRAIMNRGFDVIGIEFPLNTSFLDLGQMRTGHYLSQKILETSTGVDFKVSMKNLTVKVSDNINSTSQDFRLLLNEELVQPNTVMEFKDTKTLTVTMITLNNMTGKVSFDLVFDIPSKYLFFRNITTITLDVVNYQLLKDFNTTWFDNKVFCKSINRGTFENSAFECLFEFPATTDIESLNLPVSPQQLASQERTFEDRIQIERDGKNYNSFLFTTMSGMFILSVLVTAFMVYVYPIFRIRPR